LIVEELGVLDERGVGECQKLLFHAARGVGDVDNEVDILKGC
jgi:hypothetical protein